jgi:two-component system OmpR family response regulator
MVTSPRRVLIVEPGHPDERVVAELAAALETAGFSVRVVLPDESAADAAARFRPEMAVVALGSSASAGDESVGSVVHRLRTDHGLPVVLVEPQAPTAADRLAADPSEPADRLAGSPVVQTVAALIGNTGADPALEAGDLVVDESARVALRADEPLDLTRLEFDLLAYFVRNRNRVLSREALLSSVWRNMPVTPNAIEAVVSKLRAKLEESGPRLIHTVRGIGYVLRVEGTSPFDLRRHQLLADRERILRDRDDVLARRDEVRRDRDRERQRVRPNDRPSRG